MDSSIGQAAFDQAQAFKQSVSVGAVIGIQSLGTLFTDGLRRNLPAEIIVGIVGTVVLALILDRLLALVGAWLTRWRKA